MWGGGGEEGNDCKLEMVVKVGGCGEGGEEGNDCKLGMVVKVGGCGEEGGRWHLRGADVGACLSLCFKQGTRP